MRSVTIPTWRTFTGSRGVEKAVAAFRRATELKPESETASLGLFHCLWEMGRKEEALDEIGRYLKIADCEDYRNILAEINAILE